MAAKMLHDIKANCLATLRIKKNLSDEIDIDTIINDFI
jgi:hypothetical protein